MYRFQAASDCCHSLGLTVSISELQNQRRRFSEAAVISFSVVRSFIWKETEQNREVDLFLA